MQSFKNRAHSLLRLASSRAFAVSALSVAMAAVIYLVTSMVNTIYIYDGSQTLLRRTFEEDPYSILEDNGIITMSADRVDFTGIRGGYGEINIQRAFPVTVTADGKTQTLEVVDGTVGSLLTQLGIRYDGNDILTPDPQKLLEENQEITLQRVEHVTRTQEEAIPHEVEIRTTPLLRDGSTMTLEQGRDGARTLSYTQRTVDGVVEEETLVSDVVHQPPVTQVLLQGGDAPVSPLEFDVPIGEDGVPVRYSRVLTDQVATGYSAGPGDRGASGEVLSAGYVAVHPGEIPYGTRMYIASPDGSFVYGYAIAADTGAALLDDLIDVDLYYDTHAESRLNGRRTVNIYLLD